MTRYEPSDESRETVKRMAGYGLTAAEICILFGQTEGEFRENFRAEMRIGPIEAKAAIRAVLHRLALEGDIQAISLWMELNNET